MTGTPLPATYVLPIRTEGGEPLGELTDYMKALSGWVDQVLVVDGSDPAAFAEHQRAWGSVVTHLAPDGDLRCRNGKVSGVLTGVRRAGHETVVIADDDVRYDPATLRSVVERLTHADVVRPQNYFLPVPWHARWDTARILLNRLSGGDFPGTLAVRRSTLARSGGYNGDVLFENLELMRTVEAAGGRVDTALDCYVRRVPPSTRHFVTQRVRQAYDEFARPLRLLASLALLPAGAWSLVGRRWSGLLAAAAGSVLAAEAGRRRAGGRRFFPATSALLAPAWLAERAVCAWLAVGARLAGGCRYAGATFRRAATPVRELRGLRAR